MSTQVASVSKPLAIIPVSSSANSLGLKSRFDQEILGKPLLRLLVQRVIASQLFSDVCLIVNQDEISDIKPILDSCPCRFALHQEEIFPNSPRDIAKGKWAMTGWQGGLDGFYSFSRLVNKSIVEAIDRHCSNQPLVVLSPDSPFFLQDVVENVYQLANDAKNPHGFAFSTAPPGLNAVAFSPDGIKKLIRTKKSISDIVRFSAQTTMSLIPNQPYCYCVPVPLAKLRSRFCADTHRGLAWVRFLCDELPSNESLTMDSIIAVTNEHSHRYPAIGSFPREIELELTGATSIKNSLFPEGMTGRSESFIDIKHIEKLISFIDKNDDVCLTLGGFGDPLLHPQFSEILALLSSSSLWGLHVASNGSNFNADLIETLRDAQVDVVSIGLHAIDDKIYDSLCSGANFDAIKQNIFMLHDTSTENVKGGEGLPIVVPEFIKVKENFHQLYDFFEYWHKQVGSALIKGFNDYSGLLPNRNMLPLEPASNFVSTDLIEKISVFSNGEIPWTIHDANCQESVGNIQDLNINEFWLSDLMQSERELQFRGQKSANPYLNASRMWP